MKGNKENAQKVMLSHSKAKVDYYSKYLDIYVKILSNSKFISKINIYDAYCGKGIYEDGSEGSPIQAFRILSSLNIYDKIIRLVLNDGNVECIENVRREINKIAVAESAFNVEYYNLDAIDFIKKILVELNQQCSNTRNLIFIDPYGYSNDYKMQLESLMEKHKTEIFLFVPIDFIYRFMNIENAGCPAAKPIKSFLESFFPDTNHPVRKGDVQNVDDLIAYLNEALSMNKYYTTFYKIERKIGHFFAVFFITSHIYGLEKNLEAKWRLDENNGVEFKQPKAPTLFDSANKEEIKNNNFNRLKDSILSFLNDGKRTNKDLYEFTLRQGFLPKHTNEVLRYFQNQKKISVKDDKGEEIKQGTFYISYKPYKKEDKKIIFELI